MLRNLLLALLVASVLTNGLQTAAAAKSPAPLLAPPEFQINLDSEPESRFSHVIDHFKSTGVLDELYHDLVDNPIVKAITAKVAQKRGPETPQLMREVTGIATALGWPTSVVQTAQILYEVQTLMVPVTNFSLPFLTQEESQALMSMIEQRSVSFGCTGIIARAEADGTVYHARNLDFSFAKYLQRMTYNAVFMKGGKELYTAQMIAVYQMVLTGIRKGTNGYTFEVNTRFGGKWNSNKQMLQNVFVEKRVPSGWVKRQILQAHDNFEDAVHAMSTSPYAAPEYNIISGVKKGTILGRDPDGLVYHIDLGPTDRYIIMTNFDYIYHDIKEWFDPTSVKGIGHSRRLDAERLLNASASITPTLLEQVLSDDGVMAKDTIFRMVANVEKNEYNTSLPPCKACSVCAPMSECRNAKGACCTSREHYTMECGGLGGGYRCGCLPDGACRFPRTNMTEGDEDCCSFESHFTLECPSTRRCGKK
jgi:hypothetical protein